jgi:hypothetical protein
MTTNEQVIVGITILLKNYDCVALYSSQGMIVSF